MITVQIGEGKETFEDLLSLLKGHPEIEQACLCYSINRCYRVEEDDGTVFYMTGDAIDWEYSFIGPREMGENERIDVLMQFAENYGIWDESDMFLEETTLIGFQDGYDPDAKEFPDREWPGQGEVGCLMVNKVRLPSGKEVVFP